MHRERKRGAKIQKTGGGGRHFDTETQSDPFHKLTEKKAKNKTKQNSPYNMSFSWSQA